MCTAQRLDHVAASLPLGYEERLLDISLIAGLSPESNHRFQPLFVRVVRRSDERRALFDRRDIRAHRVDRISG